MPEKLQDKNEWTLDNASYIADSLGYELCAQFLIILEQFIGEVVLNASVCDFLPILAGRYFQINGESLTHKKASTRKRLV